jgi:hypothetical protein
MGLFYTNITLYKAQQHKVASLLNKLNRTAYISPPVRGFTVVYDKETEDQDLDVLMKLAVKITKKLKCVALASLVIDSDVYIYCLYDTGRLLDVYDSVPGYFDPKAGCSPPEGGDVKKLCEAFEKPDAFSEVSRIFELVKQGNLCDIEELLKGNLDEEAKEWLNGEDIHVALVRAFDMPSFAACTGYYTIVNTDLPRELDRSRLVKLP